MKISIICEPNHVPVRIEAWTESINLVFVLVIVEKALLSSHLKTQELRQWKLEDHLVLH